MPSSDVTLYFSYNCKMNILVTGANGFLGQHLSVFLANNGFQVIAVSRGERKMPEKKNIIFYDIELTNVSKLKTVFSSFKPAVVVHTAAMSKPDECHANKALCLLNNVDVTGQLLQLAAEYSSHFMYVSTDFIFGENGPHTEDAEANPLNFYGESKWMAEQLVRGSGLTYNIIRPVFIYGKVLTGMRPSFLHWVKQNLEQGKSIKVVTDQLRTPTYVEDICKGIYAIINKKAQGAYHLAGKDLLSPFNMALTVADILKLDAALIEPVTADTFPETVVRAKRSGLQIEKAIRELDYAPVSFAEGVALTFSSDLVTTSVR